MPDNTDKQKELMSLFTKVLESTNKIDALDFIYKFVLYMSDNYE